MTAGIVGNASELTKAVSAAGLCLSLRGRLCDDAGRVVKDGGVGSLVGSSVSLMCPFLKNSLVWSKWGGSKNDVWRRPTGINN